MNVLRKVHLNGEYTKGVSLQSKRNHFEISIGTSRRMGLMGGIEFYQKYDWWRLVIGLTIGCVFITVFFRWRVFGCQYNRFDKDDYFTF